jgi:hypothetical protein
VVTIDTNCDLRTFRLDHLETLQQEIVKASNLTQIENAGKIVKIESIPHHFTAFSVQNVPQPSVTVHCLDYIVNNK